MLSIRKSLHFIRSFLDIFILLTSYFFTKILISKHFFEINNFSSEFLHLLIIIFVWIFISKVVGLYDEFRTNNFSFELISIVKCVIAQSLAIIFIQFVFNENQITRFFIFVFTTSFFISIVIEKYFFRLIFSVIRKRGRNLRSLLIVGAGEVGEKFYSSITNNSHFGYFLLGFIDDNEKLTLNGNYLGKIDALQNILCSNKVDDVIIALPNYAEHKIEEIINVCEKHTTHVKIIPDYFKFVTGSKYSISMFDNLPIISLREDRINELHWRILKRLFDILFSLLIILVLLSWLLPLIICLIKLSSKGPVFFKQERWGRGNKRFFIWKFRTMDFSSTDINEKGEYIHAIKNDPRIYLIGSILRKTNLDEIPQFWNVLKGQMSIVGPRPHPTPLNIESKDKIKQYMLRHLVKPGITGWAQIHGLRGNAKEVEIMQRRVFFDIWYIENWSFILDIQIIINTIWRTLTGDAHAY